MMRNRKKRFPEWLTPVWEQKKRDTAERVSIAVDDIKRQGESVTLRSICDKVKALYGISISPNTIKRNNLAYEIYRQGQSIKSRRRDKELVQLCSNTPDAEKSKLHSKISRLRRSSKDALIAKIILLEQSEKYHEEVENTLREEIILLNLKTIESSQRFSK